MPGGAFQPPPAGPPPRKKRSPLVWIIPLVVVVIVAVVVPVVLTNHGSGSSSATSNSGGGAPNAGAQPGQSGTLLRQTPGAGSPRNWGSTPVYDACTILPMQQVLDTGIPLEPGSKSYADRVEHDTAGGPGQSHVTDVAHGLTNCLYMGTHSDQVSLEILQAPFNTSDDFDLARGFGAYKTGNYHSQGGFIVYTPPNTPGWQPGQSTVYIFHQTANDMGARLGLWLNNPSYNGKSQTDVINSFVNTVITALNKPPVAASTTSYISPYDTMPDPCTLFTRDDFKQILGGLDDDGRPHAEYQQGQQTLAADPGTNAPGGNYIVTSCERATVKADTTGGGGPGFYTEFDVFQTPALAQQVLAASCSPAPGTSRNPPPIPVDTKIGDGQTCFTDSGKNLYPLVFMSGRTVVRLQDSQMVERSVLPDIVTAATFVTQALVTRLARI